MNHNKIVLVIHPSANFFRWQIGCCQFPGGNFVPDTWFTGDFQAARTDKTFPLLLAAQFATNVLKWTPAFIFKARTSRAMRTQERSLEIDRGGVVSTTGVYSSP